jgi:hypothetical protein
MYTTTSITTAGDVAVATAMSTTSSITMARESTPSMAATGEEQDAAAHVRRSSRAHVLVRARLGELHLHHVRSHLPPPQNFLHPQNQFLLLNKTDRRTSHNYRLAEKR